MREVFGGARIVTLTVRDLARSRAFWETRLGFAVERDGPGPRVLLNLGNFRLRLAQADDARPFRGAGASVTFRVRNLARTARELDERGVAYEEHTGPHDGTFLETGDPDGYRVVFTERI